MLIIKLYKVLIFILYRLIYTILSLAVKCTLYQVTFASDPTWAIFFLTFILTFNARLNRTLDKNSVVTKTDFTKCRLKNSCITQTLLQKKVWSPDFHEMLWKITRSTINVQTSLVTTMWFSSVLFRNVDISCSRLSGNRHGFLTKCRSHNIMFLMFLMCTK